MDATGLVRSADAGHDLPGGQRSSGSACMPRRNISGRASTIPLDLAIQPAEGLQRPLACSRVSRPSASLGRLGSNGVRGRQGGGVRPGTRDMRRYLCLVTIYRRFHGLGFRATGPQTARIAVRARFSGLDRGRGAGGGHPGG